ncbi:MAG: hypothetical protein HZB26_25665 [Candidatus Hydrogenedentes bacterium]|nr:hypothetical protein [Candidatus Hydrogenedentota bacterium]
MNTKTIAAITCLGVFAGTLAAVAQSGEYVTFESKKYGYSIKLPKELKMEGKEEDKTTSWSFQPGSTPAAAPAADSGDKGKSGGKGLGGVVKGLTGAAKGSAAAKAPAAESPKQELEPAVGIYVNWVWMPDVPSNTLFETNKKSDQQDISSPDPNYKDLVVMDKKAGYAIEGGSAYRYKEKDKKDPADIHRWHVKAFGNKSFYTLGFTGTYKQFEKWAPEFEESIKSFKLIPMKDSK